MVVRTNVSFGTLVAVRTLSGLIVFRMILQFLPAVAFLACHLVAALRLVFRNEVIGVPLWA